LYLSPLEDSTCRSLQKTLPAAASLHNPIDMLASASPEQYAECLRILLADSGVGGVLVILPPPPMFTAGAVAKSLIPVIHAAEKPVVVALMGERLIQEAVEHFRAARVPEYRFPERAASALAILAERAEYMQSEDQVEQGQKNDSPISISFSDQERENVQSILEEYNGKGGEGLLPVDATNRILTAYGIPTPVMALARSSEEAVTISRQIGFPVALKVASEEIPHKSDVGGVALGLVDEVAVLQSYSMIMENVRGARPGIEITGLSVQQMITSGQEVIVGAVRDPQFGALVMFGSGGVEVEGLRDIDFALAPLDERAANQMLENTWAGRKLRGYRNIPAADRQAVIDVLIRLSWLAADFPCFSEMEINPLRVLAANQGAWAVDARLQVSG
jgi:acyl-CoA synthetase (NDP forming)